jgi:gluconate 2-dehydrogenase gamma chain
MAARDTARTLPRFRCAAITREGAAVADDTIPRRKFLLGAGIAGTAAAAGLKTPAAEAQTAPTSVPTPPASNQPQPYLTLSAAEAAFISAVADTMIPADDLSPSGTDCGLVTFVDRQLAGSWGGGAKLYRGGPFRKGKAEHGYQLPLTPREFFAVGIAATNAWTRKLHGKDFDRLDANAREDALRALESGKAEFVGFNARQFFGALLNLIMEGFFADPIHGGNKNKAAWRMIGFPGLPAHYADLVDEYRHKRYAAEPKSIADFS